MPSLSPGALLGFLVFNFPPARIFLGDGGAYLIGFCIAALSLLSSHKGSIAAVLLVTVVALGVPILDTSFAILRRGVRGFPLFHADDEHFHHKLERLGFSKRRIVLGLYGVCVVLSIIGLSIFWSQGRTLPIGIGALFILAVVVLRYFHFIKSWDDVQRRMNRVMNRRSQVRYVLVQAQLLELEVQRCQSGDEFWPIFHHALKRVGFVQPGEVEDDVIVHVKYNGSVPWMLHAPRHGGHVWEWQRIAECFQPRLRESPRQVAVLSRPPASAGDSRVPGVSTRASLAVFALIIVVGPLAFGAVDRVVQIGLLSLLALGMLLRPPVIAPLTARTNALILGALGILAD